MNKFTTPIIPIRQTKMAIDDKRSLDHKAICIFAAIGFFLDDDTYFANQKILKPATYYSFDTDNQVKKAETYFNWHHTPRNMTFNQALEEFTTLFETIIKEQTEDKKIILPLSGGIDSRTQAAALKHLKADVLAYSYEFQNGYPETKIAKQIAEICDFQFKDFQIKKGYLWDKIDDLAKINGCYSDFTSPRQMAIVDEFTTMGDIFSLGHWGDVLFDNYGLNDLSHEEEVQFISKTLLKRGGLQFTESLWQSWKLVGNFKDYFLSRISDCLKTINIDNTNAKLRAFKSKYWAPRWTSVNLSVFEQAHPITLPYYDNRMCEFICTIPEEFLADRKLQIAYIKKLNPKLAKIVWQDKRPYNLYNFNNLNILKTYSYKVENKLKRIVNSRIGKPYIQRNWELQFLGEENKIHLENALKTSNLSDIIPVELTDEYLQKFYSGNALKNAHSINMLITLAKFNQHYNNG